MKLTEEILESMLPSGSGIDCNWNIEDKGTYFKAQNSFHCMNDIGYYDGYQDFTLIIPKKSIGDYKLHFNGSQYKAKRYGLREYLDDIIYNALYSLIIPQAQSELCKAEIARLDKEIKEGRC